MGVAEWITALALLALVLGGLYVGVLTLARRKWAYPPNTLEGQAAIFLGLFYLAGAAAAALGLALMLVGAASG